MIFARENQHFVDCKNYFNFVQIINDIMALAIKIVPTLSGEDAINFEEKANKVEENPHTIDCSKDIEVVRQYLNSIKL